MYCATNIASISGVLISSAVILILDLVIFLSSFSNVSTPEPPFPMTIPGFETLIKISISFSVLSISITLSPAVDSLLSSKLLIFISSSAKSAYCLLSAYHLEIQSLDIPSLKPVGFIFCPILLFNLR